MKPSGPACRGEEGARGRGPGGICAVPWERAVAVHQVVVLVRFLEGIQKMKSVMRWGGVGMILGLAILAAGCGESKPPAKAASPAPATAPTPAPEETVIASGPIIVENQVDVPPQGEGATR